MNTENTALSAQSPAATRLPRSPNWNFQAREPERQRNASSLEARWRIIKKEVSKFCGKFAQAKALNPSGFNEKDIFEKAKLFYLDDVKKEFKLKGCYKILSMHEKWICNTKESPRKAKGTKRAIEAADGDDVLDIGEETVQENPRLEGRKKGKALEETRRKINDMVKTIVDAGSEVANSSKGLVEALELKNELDIMAINLFTVEPDKVEYYRALQSMYMQKRLSMNKNN
ncbi:hypothetical protein G6F46_002601 [Rhizopus delemar]|uniref:No apical meristem-associated C-terminal domain-containing protein n=2 Tax=Rhizopus TaxID=4842 RepID=A0A9P6YTS6_9FUNG|nr:hypothetical protein G6F55_001576 [Rhizopus delemar]KAG1542078.1 hypothetical protein G6F51_007496 [Rhizopus arrhizus]KAG1498776.1 hypothetical protein G6F54_004842 [Rhizopus delemar]KAG1512557.1 hypothetical protein G6F53_005096 [Rhizopus delemar]KAG1562828.1 hypothetical protein G6F49_000582 [Rhizopus delemar]